MADLEPAEDGALGLPGESPRRVEGLLHDALEGCESERGGSAEARR